MRKFVFLIVLIISSFSIFSVNADNHTEVILEKIVVHLNDYLLTPLDLNDKNVTWDWAIITGQDIVEDCRVADNPSLAITDVFYDVTIYRLDERYHYRMSMDETLILRCEMLPTVPDNVMPQLIDALSDLSARLHMSFTHNDIPWTWSERQFDDYTLGCNPDVETAPRYDRRTNGYVVKFTVQGETWEYRVSADRLVVVLCATDDSE